MNESITELVVIFLKTNTDIQVTDVVAKDNFVGFVAEEDTAIVKSNAIDEHGQPYIRASRFKVIDNENAVRMLTQWSS